MTLNDYILEALSIDYREGKWDCVIFVARWMDRVCGSDLEGMVSGQYDNKLQGLRKFCIPGPTTVSGIAARFIEECKWQRVEDLEPGDVVALENGDLGLMGEECAFKLMPGQVVGMVPLDHVTKAWRWKGGESWAQ